jgi:hypothetical protein
MQGRILLRKSLARLGRNPRRQVSPPLFILRFFWKKQSAFSPPLTAGFI